MQQSLIKIRALCDGDYELMYIDTYSDEKGKKHELQIMTIDPEDLRRISSILKDEAEKVGK